MSIEEREVGRLSAHVFLDYILACGGIVILFGNTFDQSINQPIFQSINQSINQEHYESTQSSPIKNSHTHTHTAFTLVLLIETGSKTGTDFWLSAWSNDPGLLTHSLAFWLGIYSGLGLLSGIATWV
jgi:hypothetical protein